MTFPFTADTGNPFKFQSINWIYKMIFLFVFFIHGIALCGLCSERAIGWEPSIDEEEKVVGYTIYYKMITDDNGENFEEFPGEIFSHSVGYTFFCPLLDLNLKTGKTYAIVVRAYNRCGVESDNSELLIYSAKDEDINVTTHYPEDDYTKEQLVSEKFQNSQNEEPNTDQNMILWKWVIGLLLYLLGN